MTRAVEHSGALLTSVHAIAVAELEINGRGGYFSLTKNRGGRSLPLVGGASDWTNHKLIGIGGLRQPESDSSHGRAAEAGEQQMMETAD